MPPNAMLLHVDYAESYENKQQDECQSAYFGHSTFSLFTAAVYIRHEESLINENFVIVSEAKDHCSHMHYQSNWANDRKTLSSEGLPEPWPTYLERWVQCPIQVKVCFCAHFSISQQF